MKLEINIEKKHFWITLSTIVIITMAIFVYAFGTDNPPNFGHTVGEIEGLDTLVPSGAVLAFNLATCPSGWSRFTDADGRVITGLSSEAEFNTLLKTGGEKTHTLTVKEMPSHTHKMAGSLHTRQESIDDILHQTHSTTGSTATSATGGGAAHNNLQPYVTLLYCVKN
ncbi:hypothetical protein GOV08_04110 [Candidatus Woesearchaeota archaeon]|nr:hypothetical protein [Candidatus Woesearchaeota archaeon]